MPQMVSLCSSIFFLKKEKERVKRWDFKTDKERNIYSVVCGLNGKVFLIRIKNDKWDGTL